MHPENLYLNGVNYDEIYRENPQSRNYLFLNDKGKAQLFNTKEAQEFITTLLLKVRFKNYATFTASINFSVEVVSSTVHTVVWVMEFFIAKTSSHSMPNIGPYHLGHMGPKLRLI